ncbi:hypothetical protein Tco_0071416 [Tanacetum coccineum]
MQYGCLFNTRLYDHPLLRHALPIYAAALPSSSSPQENLRNDDNTNQRMMIGRNPAAAMKSNELMPALRVWKSETTSRVRNRQTENKRKFENTSRNSQNQQQQQIKRQNTGRAYTAGSGDKKPYGGSRPLCLKCNYHHDGPCAPNQKAIAMNVEESRALQEGLPRAKESSP